MKVERGRSDQSIKLQNTWVGTQLFYVSLAAVT